MFRIQFWVQISYETMYSLLVDMKYNKLLDSLTQLRVQGIVSQESLLSPIFFNIQPFKEFEAILSNFPDVTQPQCGNNPIKHDVILG